MLPPPATPSFHPWNGLGGHLGNVHPRGAAWRAERSTSKGESACSPGPESAAVGDWPWARAAPIPIRSLAKNEPFRFVLEGPSPRPQIHADRGGAAARQRPDGSIECERRARVVAPR